MKSVEKFEILHHNRNFEIVCGTISSVEHHISAPHSKDGETIAENAIFRVDDQIYRADWPIPPVESGELVYIARNLNKDGSFHAGITYFPTTNVLIIDGCWTYFVLGAFFFALSIASFFMFDGDPFTSHHDTSENLISFLTNFICVTLFATALFCVVSGMLRKIALKQCARIILEADRQPN